jgi:nickel/cobalt transporter (NicO) family protein
VIFANATGLYWAGIASTFAMALGTALTVSAIAAVAVYAKSRALRLIGADGPWLDRIGIGLRLLGGLFIAGLGGLLLWASLGPGPAVT